MSRTRVGSTLLSPVRGRGGRFGCGDDSFGRRQGALERVRAQMVDLLVATLQKLDAAAVRQIRDFTPQP